MCQAVVLLCDKGRFTGARTTTIQVYGRLGRAPEQRTTVAGKAMVTGAMVVDLREPRASAGENEKAQNKLLEAQNGERLDFGVPGASVGADPQLATVGGGDGAEVRRG